MSRVLTTYKNPSIADRLAAVTTIEQLAAWRVALQEAYQNGQLKPSEKTVRTWHERLWEKVFALIAAAPTPSAACFVYNVTLRWLKPEGMQENLWRLLSARVAQLPNDVERLAHQGVTIEGVSTPEQCAIAEAVRKVAHVPRASASQPTRESAPVRIDLREEAAV